MQQAAVVDRDNETDNDSDDESDSAARRRAEMRARRRAQRPSLRDRLDARDAADGDDDTGTVDPAAFAVRPIEEYQPLVRQIAYQVAQTLPRHIEVDELISAGYMGLVEASSRYDPARGVRFESFVAERIRGAVIDFLRSMDWAPRSVRSAGRRIEEARTRLTAALGRPPSEEELCRDLGMPVEELRAVGQAQSKSVVLALDRSSGDGDDDEGDELGAAVADDDVPAPEDMLERKETVGILADVINCLPEQARTVVGMYYFEGMQMSEIGEMLGVTQSRASQIHSAALELLKDAIDTQTDPDGAEDWSNPKGRKAKRLAKFFTAVAENSDWRERLADGNRTVSLDLAPAIRVMEERHGMSSAEFLAGLADGSVTPTNDTRRWLRLLRKAGVAGDDVEPAA